MMSSSKLDCPKITKQRGVALIVVLLIVAVVTILATQMTHRLQLNIARTMNIKDNNQAYWYAMGAEQYAKKSLRVLINMSTDNINLSQPWAQPFEYPITNGIIKAQLTDLQACFNINGVLSRASAPAEEDEESSPPPAASPTEEPNKKPDSVLAFEDLLKQYIEDSLVVDTVRDSIIDWLDEDNFSQPYGAEDVDYESLPQHYLAANQPFLNLTELRLVNGISEGYRQGWLGDLLEQLCVIPENQYLINVNTLDNKKAPVLAALTGLSRQDATQLIANRPEQGYDDINDFLNEPEVSALGMSGIRVKWFDVTTKYFKLSTSVEMNNGSQFRVVTMFKADSNEVKIIGREFGGM